MKPFTFWVHRKNQCRFTIWWHPLLWNKHWYQPSADILFKISLLTHFLARVFSCTPWNTSENQRFHGAFRRHRKRSLTWIGLRVKILCKFYILERVTNLLFCKMILSLLVYHPPTLKDTISSFLPSHLLSLQTVQALFFRQSPLDVVFLWPSLLKTELFIEPPYY